MNKMIEIVLTNNGSEFLRCNYVRMDPYAPNSGRKFVFSSITLIKNLINWDDRISVDITVFNEQNKPIFLNNFEIFVLNFDSEYKHQNEWWVYGNVFNIDDTEYRQGKIDVFDIWQRGQHFDWFSLHANSQNKLDYISACLNYSGISKKMIKRDVYQFDMSLIKEERDFYYLASLQFIGDKGYFGHDLYTFEDCLLELYNYNGYFYNKRMIFFNTEEIVSKEMITFFQELRKIFFKYKFSVEYFFDSA